MGHWTKCSSPEGYAVCHGPNGCPDTRQTQPGTGCNCSTSGNGLSLCINDAVSTGPLDYGDGSYLCEDGGVLVNTDSNFPTSYFCLPFDVGVLFAKNGGAKFRVRYADWHAWTGDALPEPTSCATIKSVPICGGHCGGCGVGDVCTVDLHNTHTEPAFPR